MDAWLASLGRIPMTGEALSVLAGFFWAVAIVIFRVAGRDVPAVAINLFKNALAVLLLAATMAALGLPLLPPYSFGRYALFFASGALGIAVSDTLFLMALNRLGAELTAIVDCAYSPSVIGLSFLFLGERMRAVQFAGAGLIVAAVFLVSRGRVDARIPPRDLAVGLALGALSVVLMGAGIVMVKPALPKTALLWGSFARMVGGTAALLLYLAVHPRRAAILRPLGSLRSLRLLVPGSLSATYLSSILWLAGMTLVSASVAAALNQLSTIFIFGLGALFLKEKVTPLKLAAVILAFAGAMLVTLG